MSLFALGMAEEFKGEIAVNCLWPRTAIYTAAMEMLGGGKGIMDQCRRPEIMSDSAYAILCKDHMKHSGYFHVVCIFNLEFLVLSLKFYFPG